MALPQPKPLPTGTAHVDAGEIPIRALSRLEVRKLRTFQGRAEDAEPFIVACGADVSVEDATAYLGGVMTEDGGALVDAILRLSGLIDDEADPEDPPAGSTGAGPTEQPRSEP